MHRDRKSAEGLEEDHAAGRALNRVYIRMIMIVILLLLLLIPLLTTIILIIIRYNSAIHARECEEYGMTMDDSFEAVS